MPFPTIYPTFSAYRRFFGWFIFFGHMRLVMHHHLPTPLSLNQQIERYLQYLKSLAGFPILHQHLWTMNTIATFILYRLAPQRINLCIVSTETRFAPSNFCERTSQFMLSTLNSGVEWNRTTIIKTLPVLPILHPSIFTNDGSVTTPFKRFSSPRNVSVNLQHAYVSDGPNINLLVARQGLEPRNIKRV